MSQIFISYSRKDIDFAQKIVNALAENDLDTWTDWKSIPKGEDWEQEIYRGIEEADAFLFLISPDSVQSEMCNKEIAHAVKNGKRILPIVLRDADPKSIHPEISKRNWIFCRDGQDDFIKAIEETRKTIHIDYEWLKFHTELQVKALKWERHKDNSRLLRGKELREAEEQLAMAGSQKDPQPTELHRNYLFSSQRNEVRQRRQVTIGLSTGLVLVAILAFFGWVQRNTAITEANSRATAESNAIEEANTRATAQANAEQQAQIALARQLAAQAIAIPENSQLTNDSVRAMSLFAVEAAHRLPGLETYTTLREILSFTAMPLTEIRNYGVVNGMALSQNDKWIAVAEDNTVRVYEFATGKEISRMTHGDVVYSVNFSPDSKMIASASEDSTARVWDVQSGVEISRMNYVNWAGRAFFSSDGKWVLSWGDNSVRIWDPYTGAKIAIMDHETNVYAAILSKNKKMVVSVADGGDLIAWDPSTGTIYTQINLDTDASIPQYMIGLSQDDKYFVVQLNRSLEIWDTTTWTKLHTLASYEAYIFALSPVNDWVVTGNGMGLGQVWDLSTGTRIATFNQGYEYTMITFSPDGKWIASACDCGYVKIWNATTWQESSFMSHNETVDIYDAAFTSDGTRLVSAGHYPSDAVRIWNIAVKNGETVHQSFGNLPETVSFSPDGRYFLATGCIEFIQFDGCEGGATSIWDAVTGEKLLTMSSKGSAPIAFFSRNSQFVIAVSCPIWRFGSCGDTVHVLDLVRGKEIQQYQYPGIISSVSLSYDNKHIYVVGCEDKPTDKCVKSVKVWNIDMGSEYSMDLPVESPDFIQVDSGSKYMIIGQCDQKDKNNNCINELIHVWDPTRGVEITHMFQSGRVDDVSFSPDGELVLVKSCIEISQDSGCSKRLGAIWELQTGGEISRFNEAGDNRKVQFSEDGKKVIFASTDSIVILDVSSGKEISSFQERNTAFSISPDGKELAIGQDNWVFIFDIATKEPIASFKHDLGSQPWPLEVRTVSFSPDGKHVVSASEDQTVRVWIWIPDELISQVCNRIIANFTIAEWNSIFENEPYQRTCPQFPAGQ